MTREEIIGGLKFTIEMFLLDPTTNETRTRDSLNDLDKTTVDACEEAIKHIEAWDNVLSDLDNAKEDYPDRYGFDGGIKAAREIIEKHMGGAL